MGNNAKQNRIKPAIIVLFLIAALAIPGALIFLQVRKLKNTIPTRTTNEGEVTESSDSIDASETIICIDDISKASVGDAVSFGRYEQDNNVSNGYEEIEWLILAKEDDRALLISRYILNCKPYHDKNPREYESITWEDCTLRKYLNDDFYTAAFDEKEENRILTVTLSNPDNPIHGTKGGNDTQDKVFLLSAEELLKYFDFDWLSSDGTYGYSRKMITRKTEYAVTKGGYNLEITERRYNDEIKEYLPADIIGLSYDIWWLRSPGRLNIDACAADYCGGWKFANTAECGFGVRPALYVSIR